jgi:hypothetical protein
MYPVMREVARGKGPFCAGFNGRVDCSRVAFCIDVCLFLGAKLANSTWLPTRLIVRVFKASNSRMVRLGIVRGCSGWATCHNRAERLGPVCFAACSVSLFPAHLLFSLHIGSVILVSMSLRRGTHVVCTCKGRPPVSQRTELNQAMLQIRGTRIK